MNKTLAALIILAIMPLSCSATYISMQVAISPPHPFEGDITDFNVTLTNLGDENAHDVWLALILPEGFDADPAYLGLLNPNTPKTHSFQVNIPESANPGTYPVIVKTHYADANAYPFSTVSPAYLLYVRPTPFKMRAAISPARVSSEKGGQSKTVLEILNLNDKTRDIRVKMHAPDEINVFGYPETVSVDGKQSREIELSVTSLGALPGSTYVIVATLEYDDGSHYSTTAAGTVAVVAKEGINPGIPSWAPAAAIILLLLAVAYSQIRK
jgi:hypothetical protein